MTRLLLPAVLLVAVACLLVSRTVGSEELAVSSKKEPADKIDWKKGDFYKLLENDFDLEVKSWTFVSNPTLDDEEYKGKYLRLLLEFKTNVDAREWNARGLPFNWGSTDDGPYLEFFYFDEENVRIVSEKHASVLVDGEITHKKGEAFRVFVPLADDNYLARTKRVEVYLHPAKKKGGKGKS